GRAVALDRRGRDRRGVEGVDERDVGLGSGVEARSEPAAAQRDEGRARLAVEAELVVGLAEVEAGQRVGEDAAAGEERGERLLVAAELVEGGAAAEGPGGRRARGARRRLELEERLAVVPGLEGAHAVEQARRSRRGAEAPRDCDGDRGGAQARS